MLWRWFQFRKRHALMWVTRKCTQTCRWPNDVNKESIMIETRTCHPLNTSWLLACVAFGLHLCGHLFPFRSPRFANVLTWLFIAPVGLSQFMFLHSCQSMSQGSPLLVLRTFEMVKRCPSSAIRVSLGEPTFALRFAVKLGGAKMDPRTMDQPHV